MSAREAILGRIRNYLGRSESAEIGGMPDVRIRVPVRELPERIQMFSTALAVLAGKTFVAPDENAAREYVESVVAGRPVVTTDSRILRQCGIVYTSVPVADAEVGITGAEYALADTGSLVVMSAAEARLVSLLPPVHIALVESSRLLTGLDEFLSVVPKPADYGASTVFITGPSRTADIEQILVRGVHGPGELHAVIVP